MAERPRCSLRLPPLRLRLSCLLLFLLFVCPITVVSGQIACTDLFPSQYCCPQPAINAETQQPEGCQPDHTVLIPCYPLGGVSCDGKLFQALDTPRNGTVKCNDAFYNASEFAFQKTEHCEYVDPDNIYDFHTALLLSIFGGFLGLDRFYLGYPAIGLIKFCTFGMLMVGQVRLCCCLMSLLSLMLLLNNGI